jgi:hypothetical protein
MIPSIREAIVEERGERLRREAAIARLSHQAVTERRRGGREAEIRVPAPAGWRHLPSRA